ncbi:MAG TPA: hypothetical protein VMK83_12400 [Gaiellaceae bacterium]|nr:hypothetical protein [Gaiellaceae bacterium]
MQDEPLSVLLSRLLLAHTIELDNAFEQRMATAAPERPFRVSVVMWSNFLRFVGDGITVGALPIAAALPKARVLSTLGGMERWGYVYVAPPEKRTPPASRRDGHGSARGLRSEWVVRATEVGRAAQERWPPLFAETSERWRTRFGAQAVGELDAVLTEVLAGLDPSTIEYLPIVAATNGMRSEIAGRQAPSDPVSLLALLAQTLLAYTLEFEREAPLSLPLAENVIQVLGEPGLDLRELPGAAAVSPEAISMALTYLARLGHVEVAAKVARLTELGVEARETTPAQHSRVEAAWTERLGRQPLDRLRSAMRRIVDQRDGVRPRLTLGLAPPPEGWRAEPRYIVQTEAMLADPLTGLPRHPMVLHRGGWPDGS